MPDDSVATEGWDADDAIRGVLDPGEVVLWSGGPVATRGLDRQDVWFIIVGLWLSLTYLGVAFFSSSSFPTVALRVLPPAVTMAYIVVGRPVVRRSQRRKTVFVLTPARALALSGPPFRGLETTALPFPYQVWRRADGRGTISFGAGDRFRSGATAGRNDRLSHNPLSPWPRTHATPEDGPARVLRGGQRRRRRPHPGGNGRG